jgi:predicted HicB family RNase H-like nuclease
MSTKQQKYKRITKQIRISEENHRNLKLEAFYQGKTISQLIDGIVNAYFIERANERNAHKLNNNNYVVG